MLPRQSWPRPALEQRVKGYYSKLKRYMKAAVDLRRINVKSGRERPVGKLGRAIPVLLLALWEREKE